MIESNSPNNIYSTSSGSKCNSCCCSGASNTGNPNSSDIEDLSLGDKNKLQTIYNSNNNSGNNSALSLKNTSNATTERKLIIEQNINNNKPLSHSINNLSNTLKYLSKSVENQKTIEDLDNGTISKICTCQQSKSYPLCDNTHKIFNSETNSSVSPVYIKIDSNQLNSSNNNTATVTTKLMIPNIKKKPNNNSSAHINHEIKNKSEQEKKTENQISIEEEKHVEELQYIPSTSTDSRNQNNYFTLEEIATHNNADSCWMIIFNKVYDITTYIQYHPGGHRALLRFAGKDGTENVQFHSKRMLEILNTYYFIGHLAKHQQKVEPSRCIIS